MILVTNNSSKFFWDLVNVFQPAKNAIIIFRLYVHFMSFNGKTNNC
jgi:hypothetical protein